MIKTKFPSAKITGQDIFSVAKANGIDPIFLMSQVQLESRFGTEGAATKNTNFGGVKYVGQANAKKGTLSPDGDASYYADFNTPKDALDAQAKELARRKVEGGGVRIPKGSSAGTFVDIMQQAIDAGATPAQAAREAATASENLGIPVDSKELANFNTVAKSLTKTVATPEATVERPTSKIEQDIQTIRTFYENNPNATKDINKSIQAALEAKK